MGSILEFSGQEPMISFFHGEKIQDPWRLDPFVFSEKHSLSPNPIDLISFSVVFLQTDVAQGMIFRSKRTGTLHNFNMEVDLG